ncbi:MAG: bifunctional phosphopantothenoylcysteine decarboxylase/phosphopantothenate--cysteine ligase CoaBC, partial [Kiritimatiellae bacterium]|nr:bifunctional phosphopantothenoylcysteine decarboxylase/phosphopantothenate--cysteine ligase CoaBC [Kiritimatiellia bacterium]
ASALGLSATCIRVFCPAMNTNMWNQPVVQANVQALAERGWIRIGPDAGRLACGTSGEGRMAEPEFIASNLLHLLRRTGELSGKQVLILSGPTREHLDPVRFISNPSSGKMGRALAHEALARGADVTFISGPIPTENRPASHPRLTFKSVISADDMLCAAREAFSSADYTFFAAAVADYAPAAPATVKRPKSSSDLTLSLRGTPDIAATLGTLKQAHQRTIGFALQDEDGRQRAAEKRLAKKLDLIVLNGLSAMEADAAEYEAMGGDGSDFTSWGSLSKTECATRIFDTLPLL